MPAPSGVVLRAVLTSPTGSGNGCSADWEDLRACCGFRLFVGFLVF